MKYIITLNDFKEIVTESVKRILFERMNVIDEKMFPLAEYIYNIIYNECIKDNYDIKHLINLQTIKKYYPYNNPKQLLIIGKFLEFDEMSKMIYENQKLIINLNVFFESDKITNCSNICHELTHYINDCEGNISPIKAPKISNELSKNLFYLIYLLRDTECNSRCSQFGYYLKNNNIKDINSYENITYKNKIAQLLDYADGINLKIFNNKTLNYYRKKYENYVQKIFKIYHFYVKGIK